MQQPEISIHPLIGRLPLTKYFSFFLEVSSRLLPAHHQGHEYQCHILKRLYNLFRNRPTQQNFQRKFLEVHKMEFLYLFVVSILAGSPLQHDGQLSSNNFQSDIELFSGSQTVSSISPPFRYDVKSGSPSFRTI